MSANFYQNVSSLLTTWKEASPLGSNREADGATLDDTYVCRVLRQYYAMKSGPPPPWLPRDPKALEPATIAYAQPSSYASGAGYGGMGVQTPGVPAKLDSFLDDPQMGGSAQPQSLRQMGRVAQRDPFARSQTTLPGDSGMAARPLPGQRAGTYGVAGAGEAAAGLPAAGMTAQDRLKAKLRGGAVRSPSPASAPLASGARAGSFEDSFLPGARIGVPAHDPWASLGSEPGFYGSHGGDGGRGR
jgi:hypothetical protein